MKTLRLGAPLHEATESPEQWIATLRRHGYRTAYCPIGLDSDISEIRTWRDAADEADIIIAEVGAWSNPMSPDPTERTAALEKCRRSLELADQIGARCAVNIAGSAGSKWDGPHPDDLSRDMFDRVVETVRSIIDAVRPKHTCYTLEPMPWMFPDSPESTLELIAAVDRPAFGVHIDMANWMNCPRRYFFNADFTRECFRKLGPHIRSVHLKDSILRDGLTTHIDEVRPGLGTFDFGTLFEEVHRLNPDLPMLLEHLPSAEEYELAAKAIRSAGNAAGFEL
ncbi:MAG: sugar phosphate isomerase/epimerase family protein [Opitutaceae bacterium]